jgi:hypothetical protein
MIAAAARTGRSRPRQYRRPANAVQIFRKSLGSLAIFVAIPARLILVSHLAAARRPGTIRRIITQAFSVTRVTARSVTNLH